VSYSASHDLLVCRILSHGRATGAKRSGGPNQSCVFCTGSLRLQTQLTYGLRRCSRCSFHDPSTVAKCAHGATPQCLLVVLKSSCPATRRRGRAFVRPTRNEMQDIIHQMLGYASLHPVSPDGDHGILRTLWQSRMRPTQGCDRQRQITG
jgi:hypothetical protein